jgi:hypothetical protein
VFMNRYLTRRILFRIHFQDFFVILQYFKQKA